MSLFGETREGREEATKQALAEVVRRRMVLRERTQIAVAKRSGVSRTFVQNVLRGDQNISLFLFLELSFSGLSADSCDLLLAVLKRREALLIPGARL